MTVTETGGTPRADQQQREIITPEGVPLRLRLAERGDRLAAVLIDLSIIVGVLAVTAITAVAILPGAAFSWGIAVGLLFSFALRSFYFIYFELRWQGMTPGKRALGLRVIDRAGGRLKPEAVFARNLMREVELFLPISLLMSAGGAGGGGATTLTLLWIGLLVALPYFNKDRLRAGDIVAGTWVVEAPKGALLPDMAAQRDVIPGRNAIPFTEKQLSIYGIYELQTLENVLRRTDVNAHETRQSVAQRIQQKIVWHSPDEAVSAERFLEAFYTALRGHLERRALLGKRRENKFDTD
ncbi:MAG: RDD family protein [Alphaproteobacteria bacterium]|nr:RDD family protein [Alphaproteobacteria bacterium]